MMKENSHHITMIRNYVYIENFHIGNCSSWFLFKHHKKTDDFVTILEEFATCWPTVMVVATVYNRQNMIENAKIRDCFI